MGAVLKTIAEVIKNTLLFAVRLVSTAIATILGRPPGQAAKKPDKKQPGVTRSQPQPSQGTSNLPENGSLAKTFNQEAAPAPEVPAPAPEATVEAPSPAPVQALVPAAPGMAP
ncbi:MAG: hypothetical protein HY052_02180 [Proteobacteria bacterium]|nr:hypothetical protein [Pseudomonadota bacterium]